jgi:adenylate cyclase
LYFITGSTKLSSVGWRKLSSAQKEEWNANARAIEVPKLSKQDNLKKLVAQLNKLVSGKHFNKIIQKFIRRFYLLVIDIT